MDQFCSGEPKNGRVDVDERGQDRLWDHRQSVNNDFNAISNYFMLGQSFLLVVATSSGADQSAERITVTLLGLVLTVIWLYVQSKQKFLLDQLKRRCATELPEYAETREQRLHPLWRFSNTAIMAVILPALFAATWTVILVAQLA